MYKNYSTIYSQFKMDWKYKYTICNNYNNTRKKVIPKEVEKKGLGFAYSDD